MRFETIITNIEGHAIVKLKDLSNNSFAEIYAFGALLNKFCAFKNEEIVNVIEGFSTPLQAFEKIDPFFKSAKLSPFACRVKDGRFKFGEKDYHLKKYFSHSDAIHGLLFNETFSIVGYYSNNEAASVSLEYVYDKMEEGYAFHYKCAIEYILTSGNSLTIITTVTNYDDKLMPVADGWHPYFTLGDTINNYQLEFQSKEMLEFDESLVPTGKLLPYQEFSSLKNVEEQSFDNCFTLNFAECQPLCVLRNPPKKVQVEFYPSSSYPYLQIFTPDHRRSIAIENLSAAPDAFNNAMGLRVLEPNECASFSTKFSIRFL